MRKQLAKIGNSIGIILDRGVLELLRLDEGSTVEISTDGEVLIVAPVREVVAVRRARAEAKSEAR